MAWRAAVHVRGACVRHGCVQAPTRPCMLTGVPLVSTQGVCAARGENSLTDPTLAAWTSRRGAVAAVAPGVAEAAHTTGKRCWFIDMDYQCLAGLAVPVGAGWLGPNTGPLAICQQSAVLPDRAALLCTSRTTSCAGSCSPPKSSCSPPKTNTAYGCGSFYPGHAAAAVAVGHFCKPAATHYHTHR